MGFAFENPPANLRFCALKYLNDWIQYDRQFVRGLSKTGDDRLDCFTQAATYYRVARNFKGLADESTRQKLLEALDERSGPISEGEVDDKVKGLSDSFRAICKKGAISAASKFLWITHKSPVVILDSRVVRALSVMRAGRNVSETDYATYRTIWLAEFARHRSEIEVACDELRRVKEFTLAWALPDEEFSTLIKERWFRERVFDQFLWWNGSPESDSRD